MAVSVPNPAKCEVHAVIHFLHAKGETTAEIYSQHISVYGGILWIGKILWTQNGRCDVRDEVRSGRPCVVTDEIVQMIEEIIQTNRNLTSNKLVLHKMVKDRLSYWKLWMYWVPKILTEDCKQNSTGISRA